MQFCGSPCVPADAVLGGSLGVPIVNFDGLERDVDDELQARATRIRQSQVHRAQIGSGTSLKKKGDAPVRQQVTALVGRLSIRQVLAENPVNRLDEADVDIGHAAVASLSRTVNRQRLGQTANLGGD